MAIPCWFPVLAGPLGRRPGALWLVIARETPARYRLPGGIQTRQRRASGRSRACEKNRLSFRKFRAAGLRLPKSPRLRKSGRSRFGLGKKGPSPKRQRGSRKAPSLANETRTTNVVNGRTGVKPPERILGSHDGKLATVLFWRDLRMGLIDSRHPGPRVPEVR